MLGTYLTFLDDSQQSPVLGLPANFPNFKTNSNPAQRQAIEWSLKKAVTFIHGPPATGKTKVLVDIIRAINFSSRKERILVTAYNHVAVDEIARGVLRFTPLESQTKDITRFYSDTRAFEDWKHERIPTGQFGRIHIQSQRNSLAHSLEEINEDYYLKGLDAISGRRRGGYLGNFSWVRWYNMHRYLTRKAMNRTVYMFCTSSSIRADGMVLNGGTAAELSWPASTCLMDEVGSAKHVDIMQPIVTMRNTLRRLIFCGDDKQLGPTIFSSMAQRIWHDTWLSEMLNGAQFPVTMLNIQYRSHSELYSPTNDYFYDGTIESVLITGEPRALLRNLLSLVPLRLSCNDHTWTVHSWRSFVHTSTTTECAIKDKEGDKSSWNDAEAEVVSALFQALVKDLSIHPSKIGVITGYKNQAFKLRDKARRDNWSGLNKAGSKRDNLNNSLVHTIDSCQGTEWDIVLISLVRNKRMGCAGHAGLPRRANVATSRAREAVYFIGDYDFWKDMEDDPKDRVAMSAIIDLHKVAHEKSTPKLPPFVARPSPQSVPQDPATTLTCTTSTTTSTTTTSTTTTTITAAQTTAPEIGDSGKAPSLGQVGIGSNAEPSSQVKALPYPATADIKLVTDDATDSTTTPIVKREEQPKDEPISKVNLSLYNFLPLLYDFGRRWIRNYISPSHNTYMFGTDGSTWEDRSSGKTK